MAYDATKPDPAERISKMATDTRANFAAIIDGSAWTATPFKHHNSGSPASLSRIISDNYAGVQGAMTMSIQAESFVAGGGPSLLAAILKTSTQAFTYLGRLSFALTNATVGSETSKFLFQVKNGAGDPTALTNVFGGDTTGVDFYYDTYRQGAEVGQVARAFTAAANGNVRGDYERFRHQRRSVPTVTLSASGAGIADLLVSAVAANSITVNGFFFSLTASGAGTSQAGRTYTTSA